MLKRIYQIALRECGILVKNPIYGFCMVIFPIITIFFFTSLMNDGLPTDMPIGVVDQDNTSTSRELTKRLDSYQMSHVVAHYPNMNEARQAIQQNEIYAFLLIPKGTTEQLVSSHQPKISFYYSNTTLVAGSMLFKDLKTIAALGSAGAISARMSAMGKTENEISAFLQPIKVDLHMINNPWTNYNIYLSSMIVPGIFFLFIFLITAYSLGTELKFKESKKWLKLSDNNIVVALTGKFLPQTLIFLTIFYSFELYTYYYLGFPHPGGIVPILLLGLLTVLSGQAFGIFIFGLVPSLRMSMSVCSLWGVLSFTTSGATYPLFSMNPMLEAVAQLFPLRHYYMIYQMCIFNGYPLVNAWFNILALFIFIALPFFINRKLKHAMLTYVYIP
ncbi:MAG: ABC transporter permease [Prevotella sp.]